MLVDLKLKEFIIKKKKKNALVDRYKPLDILDIIIPYITNSYANVHAAVKLIYPLEGRKVKLVKEVEPMSRGKNNM